MGENCIIDADPEPFDELMNQDWQEKGSDRSEKDGVDGAQPAWDRHEGDRHDPTEADQPVADGNSADTPAVF